MPNTSSQATRASIALLITMVIWGSSAVVLRKLALSLSPENALALRYVLLVILFVPILTISKGWHIKREHWPRLLLTSLVGMLGYNYAVNEGFARVPAGLGTVVTMVEPIIIAIMASIFLNEKLTKNLFMGLAVSVIGALILFWPDIQQTTANPVSIPGMIYLLICCLCWAIYTIAAKPLLQEYSSLSITGWTMLLSAPPLIFLASKPIPELFLALSGGQWFELMYLVIPNALLGTLFWNYGSKHLSGGLTGTFLYLIPVIAVIAGAIVLKEEITPHLVAGGALMLAGVAIAQFGLPFANQRVNHVE